MTEQQWLTSENPIAMLRAFGTLAGVRVPAHWTGIRLPRDRQLKLFACACCRAMRDEPLNADEYDYIAHVEAAADSERVPTNPRDYPRDYPRKKLRPAVNFLQYNGVTVADYWCDPARVASLCGLSFASRAALLRDTVGNPWRPATLAPDLRTPLVLSLAEAAYFGERASDGTLDGDRLAILADALEDAGCTDATLLAALRSPAARYRGFWALDAVLGRE